MSASDAMTATMTPVLRPYLPATKDFAAGKDSPREFLERCLAVLDAWEPRIGAFVTDGNEEPPLTRALEALDQAEHAGFERLLGEQRAAWGERWADADIKIEGDIDGIETVARIPPSLFVPVIYLTSDAEESTLARAHFWTSDSS